MALRVRRWVRGGGCGGGRGAGSIAHPFGSVSVRFWPRMRLGGCGGRRGHFRTRTGRFRCAFGPAPGWGCPHVRAGPLPHAFGPIPVRFWPRTRLRACACPTRGHFRTRRSPFRCASGPASGWGRARVRRGATSASARAESGALLPRIRLGACACPTRGHFRTRTSRFRCVSGPAAGWGAGTSGAGPLPHPNGPGAVRFWPRMGLGHPHVRRGVNSASARPDPGALLAPRPAGGVRTSDAGPLPHPFGPGAVRFWPRTRLGHAHVRRGVTSASARAESGAFLAPHRLGAWACPTRGQFRTQTPQARCVSGPATIQRHPPNDPRPDRNWKD